MSALESPPTLASTWQDPWAAVTSASTTVHMASSAEDFYNTKNQMAAFGMYPHPHVQPHQYPSMGMVGHHDHHTGIGHNNNNSMNSDANSSSSAASTTSNKKSRQVNFKLDIKSEPQDPNTMGQEMCQNHNPNGIQKVPSISDLSDPESSLDIPCNQVRIFLQIWLIFAYLTNFGQDWYFYLHKSNISQILNFMQS